MPLTGLYKMSRNWSSMKHDSLMEAYPDTVFFPSEMQSTRTWTAMVCFPSTVMGKRAAAMCCISAIQTHAIPLGSILVWNLKDSTSVHSYKVSAKEHF